MFGEAILPESATVRLLYVSPLALLQLLPGVGLALVRMVQVSREYPPRSEAIQR
jgi:hypothetical protein